MENEANVMEMQPRLKRRKRKPLPLEDMTKIHENCMEMLANSNNNLANSLSQLAKAIERNKRRQSAVLHITF